MMDAAVVDASVAVKWVLEEPGSEGARVLSDATLQAPDLLLIECANILWKKVQLGDLKAEGALVRLEALSAAPLELVPSREFLHAALRLSLELKHPVYDCLYLALAASRNLPLVTADRRLAGAVRKRKRRTPEVFLLQEL